MASLLFGTSSAPRFALFGRRSRRILLSLAALLTIAAAPSLAHAHGRGHGGFYAPGVRFSAPAVRVNIAPPMPRVEYRPAVPYYGAVWAPGHWQWNGYRHIWVGGYYQAPRRGWVWQPAHWQPQFAGGFIYVPGHWTRSGYAYR
jgi:hypothetical protein